MSALRVVASSPAVPNDRYRGLLRMQCRNLTVDNPLLCVGVRRRPTNGKRP